MLFITMLFIIQILQILPLVFQIEYHSLNKELNKQNSGDLGIVWLVDTGFFIFKQEKIKTLLLHNPVNKKNPIVFR